MEKRRISPPQDLMDDLRKYSSASSPWMGTTQGTAARYLRGAAASSKKNGRRQRHTSCGGQCSEADDRVACAGRRSADCPPFSLSRRENAPLLVEGAGGR